MEVKVPHIKLTHIVYAVIGVSFLWPWNALLSASLLAKQKLAENPLASGNYSSSVMVTSTIVSLVSNFALLYLPADYCKRVKHGLLIITGSFAVLGLLGGILSGIPWFLLLLVITAVSSLGCALVQNGAMAITQIIPGSSHALAIMIGQAIAGVVPPLIPMVVGDSDVKIMAVLNFLTVCFLSIAAYILFGSKQNAPFVETAKENMTNKFPETEELKIVNSHMWGPIATIFLGFAVSLSYPVFANHVESDAIAFKLFSPLSHLVWNSGDLLGRVLCLLPQLRLNNDRWIVGYSAARFLIIGFLLALVHSEANRDVIYLFTMLLFGTTGGFFISNAIARVPACVPHHLQPAAGEIVSLAIAIGLAIGSLVSFITAALL